MSTQKWWQDNDRYIPNPWDEIERLKKELDQTTITEAALRESLTGLSRESLEYRLKIETENAALRAALPSPEKLEALAKWFDFDDANKGTKGDEVQQDLRRWAHAARTFLKEVQITFRTNHNEEVLVFRTDGFYYRGQLIEDAGEAHRLFIEFFKRARKEVQP